MTREEQKKFKEIKKYLEEKSKCVAKEYGLKKKDYIFYTTKSKMFYSVLLNMVENRLSISFYAKPFWLDDILWDVLGDSENKKQPVSLRGVGAYTINALIKKNSVEIYDLESVDKIVESVFGEFQNFVDTFCEKSFLEEIHNITYQRDVITTILLIQNKEYEKAQEFVNEKCIDSFQIGEKNFSQLASEYIGNI
mgnify:CR=1 FL=1